MIGTINITCAGAAPAQCIIQRDTTLTNVVLTCNQTTGAYVALSFNPVLAPIGDGVQDNQLIVLAIAPQSVTNEGFLAISVPLKIPLKAGVAIYLHTYPATYAVACLTIS